MSHEITRHLKALTLTMVAMALAACAATPPLEEFDPPVYPAAPDEPRFIFERTLRYNTNVAELTRSQKLRRYATGEASDVKGLVKPFGVAASNGRVYTTDTVQRNVIMFDIEGKRYKEFGRDKPAELRKPAGIDISSKDEIFVADVSQKRVVVFDLEGNYLRHIGGPKELVRPSGVSVSPEGDKVYIIDTGGVDSQDHRMHIFDAQSGEKINTIGQRGTKAGEFNLPLQTATASDGTVYVVDKGNFRVQSFDPNGNYKSNFGTIGRQPGQFFSPKGIATDKDGNIYVVDTAFGNVQLFNNEGQLLMVIGQRGQSSRPGNYMLPAGVDVDETGRVYVADQFFRKIDVYRPVSEADKNL